MTKMNRVFFPVLFLFLCGCKQLFPPVDKEEQKSVAVPKIEPVKSLSERKLEGPVLLYYDNGQLKAERNYQDGKLNGVYRMYHDNGQVKVEGAYKEDKMEGAFRYYDRNGQLEVEEVYRNNIPISRRVLN